MYEGENLMEREQMIALVAAVQEKRPNAATNLYNAFYEEIYYYILKTVKEPELASDLTQDTFIEIFQTLDGLREPAAFGSWSRKVAYHKCTAHFRKRNELLLDEDEDGNTLFDTLVEEREEFIPDEALDKEELKKTIQNMIDSLPMEQRSAIMMRYFDEMSVKEIADVQGVSEGTVKSRLNYGRKMIKQSVEDYESRTGVKLHSVGVVPLLLWFFKGYQVADGIAKVGTTVSAATVSKSLVQGSVEVGKKAASGLVKKILIGATVTTVAVGGVVAGVMLKPEKVAEQEVVEEVPLTWLGYGMSTLGYQGRYELNIEEMDDEYIKGNINVSVLYKEHYDGSFEGEGVTTDEGTIKYTITLKEPMKNSNFLWYTGDDNKLTMIYNEEEDSFTVGSSIYSTVELCRIKIEEEIVEEDAKWSGIGDDRMCIRNTGHLFEWEVYKMTKSSIEGKLTVTKDGKVEHETEFVGRGLWEGQSAYYEIDLDVTRSINVYGTEHVLDYFYINYDGEKDVFEMSGFDWYVVKMEREK